MGLSIYDIDQSILALVDPETGEIADYEALEALQMERDGKIENLALWIKDLKAEATAIRNEEKALAERRRSVENRAARLTEYLGYVLNGDKFKTGKVAISYRRSTSVTVYDGFVEWAQSHPEGEAYLRYSEPDVNKTALKEALAAGAEIPLAELTESQNIQIK